MSKSEITGSLEIKPLRNLGYWHIWALGVGSVVGDGIFLLLGQGIQGAGPSSLLAFFIAGILQLFLMLCLVELAVGMPSAGAMSVWVERFMGSWWGFLAGMSWALAWVFVGGAICLALGRFLAWFIPVNELILAAIALTLFAGLNIFGGLMAARAQLWMTIGLVAIMAAMVIFGLPHAVKGIPGNFTPFLPFGWKGMFLAIPMGAYAYMGTACLCTAGAEAKNIKDLPRALVAASVTFIVLYSLSQFVVIGSVPWNELSMAESPYVTAASQIFGHVAAGIINIAAIFAAATCVLMGTIYSPSRIFYDEATRGRLPAVFGKLHPKYRTPVFGIAIIWLINIVEIIIANYNPDFVYVTLTMQFLVGAFIAYGLSIAAAMLYRKLYPDEVANLPYKMPFPKLTFSIAIIGTVITAYFAFVGSPYVILLSLIWIVPLFLWYQYTNKKQKKEEEAIAA